MVQVPALQFADVRRLFDARDKQMELDRAESTRNRLLSAGELAAGGDLNAARDELFRGGLIDQGIRFESLRNARADRATAATDRARRLEREDFAFNEAKFTAKSKRLGMFARALSAARNQADVDTLIPLYEREFGTKVPQEFRFFENRELAIKSLLGGKEQLDSTLTKLKIEGQTLTNRKKRRELGIEGAGGDPLTKAQRGKVQENIRSNDLQLRKLDSIATNFRDDFLTFIGKGRNFVLRNLDKLSLSGPEGQQRLKEVRRFENNVNQIFNEYRRQITGAAASVQELEFLKQSVLNTDLGPTEFRSAFDQYREALKDANNILKVMLQRGIDPRTEEGGQVFDELFSQRSQSRPQAPISGVNEGAASPRLSAPEPSAGAEPPSAAIQFLRENANNPDILRQFVEKYPNSEIARALIERLRGGN